MLTVIYNGTTYILPYLIFFIFECALTNNVQNCFYTGFTTFLPNKKIGFQLNKIQMFFFTLYDFTVIITVIL